MNASVKIKATENGMSNTVMIALNNLVPSPFNPRQSVDEAADEKLAVSLMERGQIQNLVVRTHKTSTPIEPVYEVYVGHRRLSAFRKNAQQGLIPSDFDIHCNPREADDRTAFIIAMTENVARIEMTALDECAAVARAISEGSSVSAIGRNIGRTPKDVTERLAVSTIPEWAKNLIRDASRTITWGAALSRLSPTNVSKVEAEISASPVAYGTVNHINQLARAGKISTNSAIFNNNDVKLETEGDLFDADSFFVDSQAFWNRQNEEIEAKVADLERAGHSRVEVLRGQTFDDYAWDRVDSPIDATAFIIVYPDGRVEIKDNLRSKNAPTVAETHHADQAMFGDSDENDESTNNGGFLSDPEDAAPTAQIDTITSVAPKKTQAARVLAKLHLDGVAALIVGNSNLARRLELTAALGDGRLVQAPTPKKIDAPVLSEASDLMTRIREAFNDVQDAAKEDAYTYVKALSDAEVEGLLTNATALRLQHQRGAEIHFSDTGIVKMLAAEHSVNYRNGFTPNEKFFETLDLGDLRGLASELLDIHDRRVSQNMSKNDLIGLLSARFYDAFNNDAEMDAALALRLNTWVPQYF